MEQININSVLLSAVIAANVYKLPVAFVVNEDLSIPIRTSNTLITGDETLARNVNIELDPDLTPEDGFAYTINWRATLAISGHTVAIQETDVTALVTGEKSIDFNVIYLDGAWEVSNIVSEVTALLPSLTGYAPINNPTFTGTVSAPTVSGSTDNTTKVATTAYVQAVKTSLSLTNYAPKADPTFTGTVIIPTATPSSDSSTKAASTAFVQGAITSAINDIELAKIIGNSPIGSIAIIDAGAGVGAAATVTGNDIGFQINLTTGTGCTASSNICKVAFGATYTPAPIAFLQPRNNNARYLAVAATIMPSEATDGITLVSGTTPLADATQYIFNVMVIAQ